MVKQLGEGVAKIELPTELQHVCTTSVCTFCSLKAASAGGTSLGRSEIVPFQLLAL